MVRQSGLGKGLGALLPTTDVDATVTGSSGGARLVEILRGASDGLAVRTLLHWASAPTTQDPHQDDRSDGVNAFQVYAPADHPTDYD